MFNERRTTITVHEEQLIKREWKSSKKVEFSDNGTHIEDLMYNVSLAIKFMGYHLTDYQVEALQEVSRSQDRDLKEFLGDLTHEEEMALLKESYDTYLDTIIIKDEDNE